MFGVLTVTFALLCERVTASAASQNREGGISHQLPASPRGNSELPITEAQLATQPGTCSGTASKAIAYYDAPIFTPEIYGVPANEVLPKGLQVVSYFSKTADSADPIKNISWIDVQTGKCVKSASGYIDLSLKDGMSMKTWWDKVLGQKKWDYLLQRGAVAEL